MSMGFTLRNIIGYEDLDHDLRIKLQLISSEKAKWRKEKLNM